MPCGERVVDPPAGGCRSEGSEHEGACLERRMRDGQAARAPAAAAPGHDIQVEHPAAPTAPGTAAELALDGLERDEQCWRIQVAFNERDSIGEFASRVAVRGVEHDR